MPHNAERGDVRPPTMAVRQPRKEKDNVAMGTGDTGDDHPGDPINVGLIGIETDLHKIMLAAGWHPADPVTLRTSLEIAAGIVDVKDPRVQTVAELCELAGQLLTVVPAARLLLCPSCGLGRRTVELATAKVTAMVAAAKSL